MTIRTPGEHGFQPEHRSRLLSLFSIAVLAALLYSQPASAASWAGRPLADVLAELQRNGLQLIYSSQTVPAELQIRSEPAATNPIERLRETLASFGLALRQVGRGNSFAIVRAEKAEDDLAPASTNATAAQLEEIKVYASRYSIARYDAPNSVAVARSALETISGSEQDALRALHYLPGTANNGVSALAHVRGGNEDETLVQFDGVELYNPVHLKDFQGLFGLLDGEFVQSLQFFSGGYPARYGNYTSGMVDIEARHTQGMSNLLGVSMLYARAISSGSFANDAGTWLVGYRNSSLPEVLKHVRRKIGDPAFEDFVGRVSYDWRGVKVTLGALRLNDELQLSTLAQSEDTIARYHDTYLWLRLETEFGNWLASHLQISQSSLTSHRSGNVNVPLVNTGSLDRTRDTTVTTVLLDMTATFSATTALDFGGRVDRGSLRYDYQRQSTLFEPLANTFFLPRNVNIHLSGNPQGDLYSAYVSARQTVGSWLAEFGVRWDDYDYIDHTEVYSPRFNLSYTFDDRNSVRLSAGKFVQARTPNNLDITSLVPQFSVPESSRQYVLGYEHKFESPLVFHIEGYSKRNENVRQYSENILDVVTLAPEIKIDRMLVAPQSSYARGVELSIASARTGPINWWANYTWSVVRDRFRTRDVPRSFDQPHSIAAGIAWFTGRWQNSAAFTWHSGWPYRPLDVTSNPGADDSASLGTPNSQRFGAYASLDLRTQYQIPIGKNSLEAFLEVHNAFNRGNDCCRQVSVTQAPDNTLHITVRQKTWLSVVPLAGIDYRF